MKKLLLVFDDNIDVDQLNQLTELIDNQTIFLFPLTSDWLLIGRVKKVCQLLLKDESRVHLLDSGRLVNDQVEIVGERIVNWSENLGNFKVWNKSIKEWFLIPGKGVSTWWFSLLSEKNTLKTDAYFRLAQIQAVNLEISLKVYKFCLLSLSNKELRNAITKVCVNKSLQIKSLHPIQNASGQNIIKKIVRSSINNLGFFQELLHALVWLVKFVVMAVKARAAMGNAQERIINDSSILFVTYFPLVDKESAKFGIFKNRYATALQDKFKENNILVNWLLIYVPIDNWSYDDALKFASKFKENKEHLFFVYEFATISIVMTSVVIWFIQICKFIIVTLKVRFGVLYKGLSIPETNSILYALWKKSFVGYPGIEGIFYYQLFKKIFCFFSKTDHCIYYAEMQAWEKALNAAKVRVVSKAKTIGFQHTSIPKNNYRAFYSPSEINTGRNDLCKMPLPDTLACNGEVPFEILSKQSYPSLKKVEAVRQLYLCKYLSNENIYERKQNDHILLVIGSLNRVESTSLVNLIAAAFNQKQSFKIWLKGHPSLPLDGILKELQIDISRYSYEIKNENVEVLLKEATIVMVGDSTVAIEAMMFNCHVVLPVFNDNMFLSPLCGFEQYYTRVYNPDDLVTTVQSIFNNNFNDAYFEEAKLFVSKYWELNDGLECWMELLQNRQDYQTINSDENTKFIPKEKELKNFLKFSVKELSVDAAFFVGRRFLQSVLRKRKNKFALYPKEVRDCSKAIDKPSVLDWKLTDSSDSITNSDEENAVDIDSIRLAGTTMVVATPIMWEKEFEDDEDFSSLHRFDWLLLTLSQYDREKYVSLGKWGTKFVNEWYAQDFAKGNDGLIWDSYTVSERICNSIIFYHLTKSQPIELVKKGLISSVSYLKDNLEYYGQFTGNHIFNNGRAIYIAGCAFDVKDWQVLGELIILREIKLLVTEDGFLREGSSHYHFLFTRWVLEIVFFAKITGKYKLVNKLSSDVERLIERCSFFLIYNKRLEDWNIPLFGDISPDFPPEWLISLPWSELTSPFYSSTNLCLAPKQRGWSDLFGRDINRVQEKRELTVHVKDKQLFKSSGWYRLQFKESILMFRLEPKSTPRNSGHAHCDIGSYCFYFNGSPLIVDVGRLDYKAGGLGDFGISPMAHNTVCIDGFGASPVEWLKYPPSYSQSPAAVSIKELKNGFDVEIPLKGFFRINGSIELKRQFILRENELKIVDKFFGNGTHDIESFLNFDSAVNLSKSVSDNTYKFAGEFGNGEILFSSEKASLNIDHFNGSDQFLGWNIKKYGEKHPASTLKVSSAVKFPESLNSRIRLIS